jgi:hypothetical protein
MEPIEIIPEAIDTLLTQDELKKRIKDGWQLVGQVLLQEGSSIATPDNPTGQRRAMPVNVWVLNRFLIPAHQLAQTLLQSESKDELCEAIFGTSLEQLHEGIIGAAKTE